MLNTCLTVKAHEANSHQNKGWEAFTQKIIDTVAARRTKGVVFLAWGSPAGKRVNKVDKKKHLVLQSVHPSPLSAHKGFVSSSLVNRGWANANKSTVRLRSFQEGERMARAEIWC